MIKPVSLEILFEDLFTSAVSDTERRERWEEWKKLALAQGEKGRACVEQWTDIEGCYGCTSRDGDWCAIGLPCTVNPVLSFRHGITGMACCGMGYEPAYSQKEQAPLFQASTGDA